MQLTYKLHTSAKRSAKEPNDKPPNLRHEATEQEGPQRDLLAQRVEGIHAPLDLFELGLVGHRILGLSQSSATDKRKQSETHQELCRSCGE
jgi:hypothetical protein